jgi:hypothetical protein
VVRVTLRCKGLLARGLFEVRSAVRGTSLGLVAWKEEAGSGGVLNLREGGLALMGRGPSGIQGESP